MMMTARLDTAMANQAVSDGTLPKIIEGVVEQLEPEAAYFMDREGDRSFLLVFDMKDASEIPPTVEPLFHTGAKVSLQPVMNLDDLRTGLSAFGQ